MNGTRPRRDVLVALAALALLLCFEFSGADLALSHLYGSGAGFALRDHWFFRRVLHDGGRVLSGLALIATFASIFLGSAATRSRGWRAAWFGVVLLCLVAVPTLKQVSSTSCPWSLSEFGGSAPYVPHWLLAVADGGPGRCFPSGHAVAAFAFLPLYFQWRHADLARARLLLAATLAAGALFGWAQLVRGAHFASHTLWSAWLCWCIGMVAARLLDRPTTSPAVAAAD